LCPFIDNISTRNLVTQINDTNKLIGVWRVHKVVRIVLCGMEWEASGKETACRSTWCISFLSCYRDWLVASVCGQNSLIGMMFLRFGRRNICFKRKSTPQEGYILTAENVSLTTLAFSAVVTAQFYYKLINYLPEQITVITVWSHLCFKKCMTHILFEHII